MGTVRGTAPSRLSELRKFSVGGDLSNKYVSGGNRNNDGVNVNNSIEGELIIYFIGGIRYRDFFDNDGNYLRTEFDFQSQGTNTPNFINAPIIKDPSKLFTIDKPEIDNDVFIIRQSLPVFENIFRLKGVNNLSELNNYAGNGKFNIINNT